jgi:hypothetical protein
MIYDIHPSDPHKASKTAIHRRAIREGNSSEIISLQEKATLSQGVRRRALEWHKTGTV